MTNYRKVRRLSLHDAAYIASLVDGEGTITLTAEHWGDNRRLVVSISNTERPLLEFVQKAIGAGRITSKRVYSDKHTPSFAYKITNRQALNVLAQITPYLHSYKAARAALALDDYLRVTPRNGKYTRKLKQARRIFETNFLNLRP